MLPVYAEMIVGDENTVQKGLYHKVGVSASENGLEGWRRAVFMFLHHRDMGIQGDGDIGHLS